MSCVLASDDDPSAGEPARPTDGSTPCDAPAVLARAVTSLRLRALDLGDRALGRADRLVPPRRLRGFAGDSDFLATGASSWPFWGRMAACAARAACSTSAAGSAVWPVRSPACSTPATGAPTSGFDPVARAVAWCAARYPAHFRFVHADLRNDLYKPTAPSARRPTASRSRRVGDLAVATSVFTHLDPPRSTATSPRSVARTATDGSRLLTFFLLDDDSRAALAGGRARQRRRADRRAGRRRSRGDHGRGRPRSCFGPGGAGRARPRGGGVHDGSVAGGAGSAIRTSLSCGRRAERRHSARRARTRRRRRASARRCAAPRRWCRSPRRAGRRPGAGLAATSSRAATSASVRADSPRHSTRKVSGPRTAPARRAKTKPSTSAARRPTSERAARGPGARRSVGQRRQRGGGVGAGGAGRAARAAARHATSEMVAGEQRAVGREGEGHVAAAALHRPGVGVALHRRRAAQRAPSQRACQPAS